MVRDAAGYFVKHLLDETGGVLAQTEDDNLQGQPGDDRRLTNNWRNRNLSQDIIYRNGQITETLSDLAGRPGLAAYYYSEDAFNSGEPDGQERTYYDDLGRIKFYRRYGGENLFSSHALKFDYYGRSDANYNNRDRLAEVQRDVGLGFGATLRRLEDYNQFGATTVLKEYYDLAEGIEDDYVLTERSYCDSDYGAGQLADETTTFVENNTAGTGYTVSCTYDKLGRPLTMTYPNGPTLTYNYDAATGLLSQIVCLFGKPRNGTTPSPAPTPTTAWDA